MNRATSEVAVTKHAASMVMSRGESNALDLSAAEVCCISEQEELEAVAALSAGDIESIM